MNALVGCWIVAHAACVQGDRLPGVPVTNLESMAEIKDPPTSHAEREAALIALFKQAGAREDEIRVLPLADHRVLERVEEQKVNARARMLEAGASPAEIDAALKLFDARPEQLGNNLMVVLPGRTERVIGFGAHLDAAAGSQGVLDDWTSCVLLTNLYQTLRSTRPQHTYWFVLFAEEERGCLGSAAWAGAIEPKQLHRIDAFVTLECAGVGSPMAWWSGSSAAVVEFARDAAQSAGAPLEVVDFAGTSSDSLSMKSRGIPTLSLLGVDPAHLHLLHGPGDRFEAVDPDRIAECFLLLRVLAAEFDVHAQPLLWDYAKAKLHIDNSASGRKPTRPAKLDLTAAALAAPPPPPMPSPPAAPPARDGSQP